MSKAQTFPSPTGRGIKGEGRRPKISLQPESRQFVKALRENQSDAEIKLWQLLRNRRFGGLKFRRRHPIPPYVLDFCCDELKFGIELDGGHHNNDAESQRDLQREQRLNAGGIDIVRYWNHDVLLRIEQVVENLLLQVQARQRPLTRRFAPPSPEGRGL